MTDESVAVLVDVQLGAEGFDGFDSLGAPVDEVACVAVEGATAGIAFDEVLVDFGPSTFEQEAQVPEYRVVAEDAVLVLPVMYIFTIIGLKN